MAAIRRRKRKRVPSRLGIVSAPSSGEALRRLESHLTSIQVDLDHELDTALRKLDRTVRRFHERMDRLILEIRDRREKLYS